MIFSFSVTVINWWTIASVYFMHRSYGCFSANTCLLSNNRWTKISCFNRIYKRGQPWSCSTTSQKNLTHSFDWFRKLAQALWHCKTVTYLCSHYLTGSFPPLFSTNGCLTLNCPAVKSVSKHNCWAGDKLYSRLATVFLLISMQIIL